MPNHRWGGAVLGSGRANIAPRHYDHREPGRGYANFVFWDGHVSKYHYYDIAHYDSDRGATIRTPKIDPLRWVGDGYVGWHWSIKDKNDPSSLYNQVKYHKDLLWW